MAGRPEHSPLRPDGSNPTDETGVDAAAAHLRGRSAAWRTMADWVRRIAPTRLPVLVLGESGAGKEGVARAVHALSPRAAGPFLALNCAALTDSLIDTELFGALRGAYTGADRDRPGLFQRADGGTLFLDEVGDMSVAMQSKLLRALENRRVRPVGAAREIAIDVRVVAATNRDLSRAAARGDFREDLYFRLAVAEVHVPPLRERLADLPLLVEALAPRLQIETGLGPPRLDGGAWRTLGAQPWPGNVRQLHAALARALLRSNGAAITARHFESPGPRTGGDAANAPRSTATERKTLERRMIRNALRASDGNITAAARHIGWSRQKLYRRMAVLGLSVPPRNLFSET